MMYLQPLYELDELQIELQHKMKCSILQVPEIHYIPIESTGKSHCAVLYLLYDSLVKPNLVVTRIVIYKDKKKEFK